MIFIFASCSYENVEITQLRELKFSELNAKSLKISGEVKVLNPNPYPVKIKSIDADLFVNHKKTGKAKLIKNLKIPSNSHDFIKAEIDTEIDGGSLNILPLVLQSALSGNVEFRLVGDLKASSYLYSKRIEFDFTEQAEF